MFGVPFRPGDKSYSLYQKVRQHNLRFSALLIKKQLKALGFCVLLSHFPGLLWKVFPCLYRSVCSGASQHIRPLLTHFFFSSFLPLNALFLCDKGNWSKFRGRAVLCTLHAHFKMCEISWKSTARVFFP